MSTGKDRQTRRDGARDADRAGKAAPGDGRSAHGPSDRAPGRLRAAAAALRPAAGRVVRRVPVCLALIVVMWAAHLLDCSTLAVEAPYRLADWRVLTSGLTSGSLTGTAVCTAAVLVFAVPAEAVLGTRAFTLAAAGMQLLATPLGLMAARAVEETGLNRWGADLTTGALLSPVAWIFGTAVLAAARMPVLWRRRTTVAVVALSVTLTLYAGTLSDVAGLTAVVLGLLARRGRTWRRPSVSEVRVLVATVLLCVAVGPLVTRLNPHAGGPLVAAGFFAWQEIAGHLAWFMVNAAVTAGIVRGRRAAWWLALAMNLISAFLVFTRLLLEVDDAEFSAVFGVNLVLIMAPWLAAVTVLVCTRHAFTVAVRARRLRQLAAVLVAAVVCAALLGSDVLLWSLVSLAVYLAVVSVPELSHARDRDRARQLLRAGSGDHLQQMTVWDGNRYWFAPHGAGYVAFRLSRGVAVTVGEPVCAAVSATGQAPAGGSVADAAGSPAALASGFEAHARAQGWQVAWYSVGEQFAEARAAAGFRRVHVADESLLLTADSGFRGKRFQNIRTARNHAARQGVTALWTSWAEAGVGLREQIVELSEQWVAERALPEMGFTLGGVPELADPDTRLLVALDSEGGLHGVTSWLPVRHNGRTVGLTLDMMRRSSRGFRPVIEFLLSEALLGAAAEDMEWISLSGAPLATAGAADGLLDRALNAVGGWIEPLYGFRSLAASKSKFHPEHASWYLLYDDEVRLPAIALAVCACYLPGLRLRDAVAAVREWGAAQR